MTKNKIKYQYNINYIVIFYFLFSKITFDIYGKDG